MTLQDRWLRVPCSSIIVARDSRQRRAVYDAAGKFIDQDGLLASVRARGVLNAVIVEERDGALHLIAGERRLEASKLCNLPDIPVRFSSDLPPTELRIIELEENLRRVDLPWRDEVGAVAALHALYCELAEARGEEWNQTKSGEAIGYSQLYLVLRVARDLASPRIVGATSIRAAYNILARIDDRATADAVSDIVDAAGDIFGDIAVPASVVGGMQDGGVGNGTADSSATAETGDAGRSSAGSSSRTSDGEARAELQPLPILHTDFASWLSTYTGPSFNFIHCDFPYGVGVFVGVQGNTQGGQGEYRDTESTYYALIEELCAALPRILSHSAHLMFWLTADIRTQHRTLELFRVLAPQLAFSFKPLIWHKTDNVGILADPKRAPRHVYETALFASTEDRLIIRAVSDTYGAPTDKLHHPSTKPEPMLRHFFSMFIDEFSRVLDPTCGSGSALRAAESLGAPVILGLEADEEHHAAACSALRSFRTLRATKR